MEANLLKKCDHKMSDCEVPNSGSFRSLHVHGVRWVLGVQGPRGVKNSLLISIRPL